MTDRELVALMAAILMKVVVDSGSTLPADKKIAAAVQIAQSLLSEVDRTVPPLSPDTGSVT